MVDIIFLIAITIFILFRLVASIGRKDDSIGREFYKNHAIDENKVAEIMAETFENIEANVISSKLPKAVEETLIAINGIDKGFTEKYFVSGAEAVFDSVMQSYKKNDLKTLKELLSSNLYKKFENLIKSKEAKEEVEETTLVAIEKAEIKDAKLEGNIAQIDVHFVSEQIRVTKNKEGKIVNGDPKNIEIINDNWKFERNLKSSDPVWYLVKTA